jgi:hypothetical protein
VNAWWALIIGFFCGGFVVGGLWAWMENADDGKTYTMIETPRRDPSGCFCKNCAESKSWTDAKPMEPQISGLCVICYKPAVLYRRTLKPSSEVPHA